MAEGIWRTLGQGEWESASAGSRPSGYVHPFAVKAMHQREIDITNGLSKSVDQFAGQSFDVVVTVCNNAREDCPVFPNAAQTLHRPFDDPADATGTDDEQLITFIRVRDEIEERITKFLYAFAYLPAR